MKKIFTLSLMAAAALGMSATTLQRQGTVKAPAYPTAKSGISTEVVEMNAGKLTPVKKAARKAPATEEDVIGQWTLTALSMIDGQNKEYEEYDINITPSTKAGKIVIGNFLGVAPEATFDADNQEIHIPYQVVAHSDEYSEDVCLANTYFAETGSISIDKADIVLYLDGDNFVFDSPIGLWGEEVSANTSYGCWQEGEMTPGLNWESIGEATYTDFLLTLLADFGDENVPSAVKVQAQRHLKDRNVYRLVAPYYDWIGTSDNLELWILDDNTVEFPFQYLITFKDSGATYWGSLNFIAGVGMEDGPSVAEFEANYPNCNITMDPETKLIEIGKVSSDKAAQLVIAYVDQWTQDDQPIYYMKFSDGSIPQGSIQFGAAALANIMSTDPNAPVEYFNIMGQRVLNPTAGQMLIRRQGSDASKIIF